MNYYNTNNLKCKIAMLIAGLVFIFFCFMGILLNSLAHADAVKTVPVDVNLVNERLADLYKQDDMLHQQLQGAELMWKANIDRIEQEIAKWNASLK